MPRIRRHKHRSSHPLEMLSLLTYVSLCAVHLSAPAYAEETATLDLVRDVQALQAQHGAYAPELLTSLINLGEIYSARECDHALDILHLALEVSRRAEGLLNPQQLQIYSPLVDCYVTLDRPAELARAQHYVMLINEAQFGRNDPRLVPALEEAAQRYEEGGLYFSARRLHSRALEIVRATAGDKDLSLVAPLRGLARAYRLEYAYGLEFPDLLDDAYRVSTLRSNAGDGTRKFVFDRLGERSLERAVTILRRHPEARRERVETLLELGDWHWLAGHYRDGLSAYREAWAELHASGVAKTTGTSGTSEAPATDQLDMAKPLLFRTFTGFARRRAPAEPAGFRHYLVDLDYAVTRDGEVRDVTVTESNAPGHVQYRVVQDLRYVRHRPRFANGEPVEDHGLRYRRHVYLQGSQSLDVEPVGLAQVKAEN